MCYRYSKSSSIFVELGKDRFSNSVSSHGLLCRFFTHTLLYTHTHPNITVSVIKYDKTKAEYNAKRYRGSEFLIRKPNAGPC